MGPVVMHGGERHDQVRALGLWIGQITGTTVGCSQERYRQDRWVNGFFGSDPRWTLAEGILTLRSGETVIKLKRRAS